MLSPIIVKKRRKVSICLIASGASNSEMALVDPVQVAKYLHKDDKLSGKLRIKKSVTKASKAKDAESNCEEVCCRLLR